MSHPHPPPLPLLPAGHHSRAPQDVCNVVGQLRQVLQHVVARDAGSQLQGGQAARWGAQARRQ